MISVFVLPAAISRACRFGETRPSGIGGGVNARFFDRTISDEKIGPPPDILGAFAGQFMSETNDTASNEISAIKHAGHVGERGAPAWSAGGSSVPAGRAWGLG